ncbi:MAG: EAL domain-containing protein [Pseudomonadota bacterium]
MSITDRLVRVAIGGAFAYAGLFAKFFGDSSVVNLFFGIFGVAIVLSSAIGVCPSYLLTKFSTKPESTSPDLKPDGVSAANAATLRIVLSVTVPIIALLTLVSYLLFDLSHDLSMSQDSTRARTAARVGLNLTSLHSQDKTRDITQDIDLYRQLSAHTMAVIFHDSNGKVIESPFTTLPDNPALVGLSIESALQDTQDDSMLMTQDQHLIRATEIGNDGLMATTLSHVAGHQENTSSRVWSRFYLIAFVLLWFGGWGAYSIARKFSQSLIHHAQALKHRSTHDPLTGLSNRMGMEEVLEERINATGANTETFALLMIDVADFRYFNDTLGYEVGDELIKVLGKKMYDNLHSCEKIIRISGDVFCVLGPVGYDRTFAAKLANTIHDLIEQPVEVRDIRLDIRCHIGVSMFPIHSSEGPELIRLADIALDQAKKSRSRTVYYQAENDSHSIRKLSLLASLRSAIDEDQLSVVYQPKIQIADGSLSGVEALVRWQHPVYNNVSPLEFIGWAEKTGLIDKLTCWVLSCAEQQCAQWLTRGYKIPVAVNLSPVNLQSQQVSDTVLQLVKHGHLGNGMLELELTENAVMEDPASALDSMNFFKDLGVDIAIDDFGTGLASFSYLRKFPVTNLKIDRVFVTNSISQARDEVLLKSMIELGHNLDCVVTAEGVEDSSTLAVLSGYGCDYAQGYHMCKPTSAEGVIEWLQQNSQANTDRAA